MKTICIFLGSSEGSHPAYMAAAQAMGREIVNRGLTCVYGGSCTGLMNELANSILACGGEIIGVTVQALKDKEDFHKSLTELHVLPTMHERKNLMIQLSDGFIALPGGIGTFEELLEVYTLAQLGFHSKPCGILNTRDFYTPLKHMLEKAEQEGFLKRPYSESLCCSEDPAELLDLLININFHKNRVTDS